MPIFNTTHINLFYNYITSAAGLNMSAMYCGVMPCRASPHSPPPHKALYRILQKHTTNFLLQYVKACNSIFSLEDVAQGQRNTKCEQELCASH